MSEEEVIKRRLIFDGDGTGEDRRLNVLLKMINKWANSNDDTEDESFQMYDKILAQLSLVEHSRRRSELITKSNDEQLKKYQELYSTYEDRIAKIKEDIATQRINLEKAKIIKQNRIQYDLLAKAIAQEPPRTEMNNKLEILQKELHDLGEEKKRLDKKLDTRKKQFNVLSTSANSLRAMLKEDEEQENICSSSLDDVNINSPGPEPMSE